MFSWTVCHHITVCAHSTLANVCFRRLSHLTWRLPAPACQLPDTPNLNFSQDLEKCEPISLSCKLCWRVLQISACLCSIYNYKHSHVLGNAGRFLLVWPKSAKVRLGSQQLKKNLEQWPAESPTPQWRDKLKKVSHKVHEAFKENLPQQNTSCALLKSAHNNVFSQKFDVTPQADVWQQCKIAVLLGHQTEL